MTKIAFSFDDGRHDNYVFAKKILEPMNIPASFNITIGYVEKEDNIEKPSNHVPMTIDELKELDKNDLFEIAGHGFEHNNDVDNLIKGAEEIRKVLGWKKDKMIGIVSPHSEFPTNTLKNVINKLKDHNIKYLRVGKRFEKFSFIKKVIRKINRKLNIPFIYSYVYKDSDVKENDDFLLFTAGIIRDNKLEEIKRLIEDAIKYNKTYILTMHSVLSKGEDYYDDLFSWDTEDFVKLCEFLKEKESNHELQLCKVIDLV